MLKTAAASVLALSVMISGGVSADDRAPQIAVSAPASVPVRLSDAELDTITAGEVPFMAHLVINNGNAFVDKGSNHILCVNCLPFGVGEKPIVAVIVQNPARTVSHCIHCPF